MTLFPQMILLVSEKSSRWGQWTSIFSISSSWHGIFTLEVSLGSILGSVFSTYCPWTRASSLWVGVELRNEDRFSCPSLPGIVLLQDRTGGWIWEVLVASPSLGETISLHGEQGGKVALPSWWHVPGEDLPSHWAGERRYKCVVA